MLQEYFIKYKKYIFVAVIAIVALTIVIVFVMNGNGNNSFGESQTDTQYHEETTEFTTEYIPAKTDNIMLNFNANEYTRSKKFKEWAKNVNFIYFTKSYPDTLCITNDTKMVYADSNYALDISQTSDCSVVAYIKSGTTSNGTYCEKLYIAGRDGVVVSSPSCKQLFDGLLDLVQIEFAGNFDTSNCIDMSEMFKMCGSLWRVDVSSLDTGNVKNMSYMFCGCRVEALDLSGVDTSNCNNMSGMFASCGNLKSLDISNFNTASCTDMSEMFIACYELEKIDLSGFDTSNVTNMESMFDMCYALKEIDITVFDFSNVEEMSRMFTACRALDITIDVSSFPFKQTQNGMNYVYNYSCIFDGTENITIIFNGNYYTYGTEQYKSYDENYGWNRLYRAIEKTLA